MTYCVIVSYAPQGLDAENPVKVQPPRYPLVKVVFLLSDLLSKKITVDDLTEYDIQPLIEQKAVDMKMGLDIASIATKRLADTLIIITGDADVVPALKLARQEGMQVGLDPLWNHIRPELSEHVDFVCSKTKPPTAKTC